MKRGALFSIEEGAQRKPEGRGLIARFTPSSRHPLTRPGKRRGAAMVEFVIVVPLLLLLVLGIMEFGMVMHDYMMLANGAREASRIAALRPGATVSKTKERAIEASLPSVTQDMVQITTYDPNSGAWVAVTDTASGLSNSVPADGVVRVTIKDYPHRMVTGNFFAWLPNVSAGTMKLNASLTMRHE
jgi:Flp pilus assembly protein TadG